VAQRGSERDPSLGLRADPMCLYSIRHDGYPLKLSSVAFPSSVAVLPLPQAQQ